MTIAQLQREIDSIKAGLSYRDNPEAIKVVIPLYSSSIGARESAEIKSINLGIDHESGRLNIETEYALVYKCCSRDTIIPAKRKIDSNQSFSVRRDWAVYICTQCDSKVNKDDRYCKYCGQRLK